MPTFPISPTNGDEYQDGDRLFRYVDPPGVWQLVGGSGLDEDLVIIAAANNSSVLSQLTAPPINRNDVIELLYEELSTILPSAPDSQIISTPAVGDVLIDLNLGTNIHINDTAGAFTPIFTNVPNEVVKVHLSVVISNNNDQMIPVDAVWKKPQTLPAAGEYAAGELWVFEFTKLPFVDTWIVDNVSETVAPVDDVVTPVAITAYYTTPEDRVTPNPLNGAILPPGEVYVWFGPIDNEDLVSFRIFSNETGTLPAVGSEGATFVGERTTPPYDLLGTVNGAAVPWDTNIDPTGNNNEGYDPDGPNQNFKVEATWSDGQTTEATFTFETSNAPPGADPTRTVTFHTYKPGSVNASVTIPDGVDRLVVVRAWYANGLGTIIDSLSLGGTTMTEIVAANRDPGASSGVGVFSAYMTEASLTTGAMTLAPTYSTSLGAYSTIIYEVNVLTNLASAALNGVFQYENVNVASMAPTLNSVPANSILLAGVLQQDPTSSEMTIDTGVLDSTIEQTLSPTIEVKTSYLADSGAAGNKTVTFTATGRQLCNIIYIDYAASGGGGGVTPITPGTPSISVSNAAGDNLLDVTWSATADAVSYELRHSASNPPSAAIPIVGVTSPHRLSGLAASVPRYVQVRAKSSTDTYSAWSTVQSGTPTGVVDPPQQFAGKFLATSDPILVSYSEGRGEFRSSEMWVPGIIRRWNTVSTSTSGFVNMAADTFADDTIANWNTRFSAPTNIKEFWDEAGPRSIWTAGLQFTGYKFNNKATVDQMVQAVLDLALTASGLSKARNDVFINAANKLNRVYKGWELWKLFHISINHETNGPWTPGAYQGKVSRLIGNSALASVTNAQFTAPVAAAVRSIAANGEIGPLSRLATERVMDLMWDVNDQIILGTSPADGDESVPEGGAVTNEGSGWVQEAWPRPSLGYAYDFIYSTIYSRDPGSMQHTGGDPLIAANWTRRGGWIDHMDEFIVDHGAAGGLLEAGVGYAVPGVKASDGTQPLPDDYSACSDNANYAFYENLFNVEFSNATRFPHGLGMMNHWCHYRWQPNNEPPIGLSGDRLKFNKTGSYSLLEGLWGEVPNGDDPGVTTKPPTTASGYVYPGNGSYYPRTRQWYRDNYPK